MKKEILMLIIGILIGAIIATGIFLVLQNSNSQGNMDTQRGSMGEMGDAPDAMDGNFVGGGNMELDTSNTVSE